jgi:probable F420-dependent oxidoreductase
MQLNAFFPSLDIGTDPAQIRDWAQAAENLGYATIEVPDHVFGAKARDGWTPLYNEKDAFHETFVTLGFLAAVTKTIRLSSGVLIAPQRQTGVIAKQAAEVDILSGGRLRLGIGLGWNPVEYEALGAQWKTRGARQAEQAEVLRRLWSQDLVTFKGRFHDLKDVSIVPPPVQRPIPIWFGGSLGRRRRARRPPGRRLDADHGARPGSRAEARLAARAAQVVRARPRALRPRSLAAHARGGPASLGGRRRRLAPARRRHGDALSDVSHHDAGRAHRDLAAVQGGRRRLAPSLDKAATPLPVSIA